MLYLAALILLSVFSCLWLKMRLDRGFKAQQNNYQSAKDGYDKLELENSSLKQGNADFRGALEQVTALYDITKQICRPLEVDKVFDYFKQELAKHVAVSHCEFLKSGTDLSPYKDYIILPLEIGSGSVGYLAASGISEKDRDSFHILAQQFILGVKRALLYRKVQELAITDSLTQIFSRRYYLERFREEIERSRKLNYNFSCLMLDIDYFKGYNDRYGHLVGDAILREVARAIKESIRQIDLLGRYGGEEFSVILTETAKEAAVFAAERIRSAIENRHIRIYDEDLKVTVSIGISTFPDDGKDMPGLIDNADLALYQAKKAGRNKVCIFAENITS